VRTFLHRGPVELHGLLRTARGRLVNLDRTPTFTPVLLRKDFDSGLKAAKELGATLPITRSPRAVLLQRELVTRRRRE
jgi:hypothetical protein